MIVSRKKDQCVDNLKNFRAEQTNLEKQLKEKRKNNGDDGEVLRGEDVIYPNIFTYLFLLLKFSKV